MIRSDQRTARNRTEENRYRETARTFEAKRRKKMEFMMIAEEKSVPQRREIRFTRSGRNQKAAASSVLEAIAQFSGGETTAAEDGRMKILVKKEDLKQVLEAIRDGRSLGRRNSASPPSVSLEQRLNLLRRRQILRAANQAKGRSRRSWRPALQSIPEEL